MLNSDNINVTGESFDYGPWRFTPEWDPKFTAAYFDHYGLYAFGRQPEAIHWDFAQLAGSLSLVTEAPPLSEMLAAWSDRFEQALLDAIFRRLGIRRYDDRSDRALIAAIITALHESRASLDRFYFDWFGGIAPATYGPEFDEVRKSLPPRHPTKATTDPYWSDAEPCSMHINEVEAIWSAIDERDDWQPFEDKVNAIRRMGDAMRQDAAG